MNEYRADEAEALDAFQRIGAAAGFFAFEFAPDLDREARDEAERRAIADFKAAVVEFPEDRADSCRPWATPDFLN